MRSKIQDHSVTFARGVQYAKNSLHIGKEDAAALCNAAGAYTAGFRYGVRRTLDVLKKMGYNVPSRLS